MFFLHENQSKKEERHFTNSPRATSDSLNDTVMTREEFQLWFRGQTPTTRAHRHPWK